jgi:hypothetical protein
MIGVTVHEQASTGKGVRQMEKDRPLKQWEDGVSLGSSWWVYADKEKKKRFRELQQPTSTRDLPRILDFARV